MGRAQARCDTPSRACRAARAARLRLPHRLHCSLPQCPPSSAAPPAPATRRRSSLQRAAVRERQRPRLGAREARDLAQVERRELVAQATRQEEHGGHRRRQRALQRAASAARPLLVLPAALALGAGVQAPRAGFSAMPSIATPSACSAATTWLGVASRCSCRLGVVLAIHEKLRLDDQAETRGLSGGCVSATRARWRRWQRLRAVCTARLATWRSASRRRLRHRAETLSGAGERLLAAGSGEQVEGAEAHVDLDAWKNARVRGALHSTSLFAPRSPRGG